MKTETKAQLRARIEWLEAENERLRTELNKAERKRWLEQMPVATQCALEVLSKIHPNTLYNFKFDRVDESGYWYSFSLINDERAQVYCVRHNDLEESE